MDCKVRQHCVPYANSDKAIVSSGAMSHRLSIDDTNAVTDRSFMAGLNEVPGWSDHLYVSRQWLPSVVYAHGELQEGRQMTQTVNTDDKAAIYIDDTGYYKRMTRVITIIGQMTSQHKLFSIIEE